MQIVLHLLPAICQSSSGAKKRQTCVTQAAAGCCSNWCKVVSVSSQGAASNDADPCCCTGACWICLGRTTGCIPDGEGVELRQQHSVTENRQNYNAVKFHMPVFGTGLLNVQTTA